MTNQDTKDLEKMPTGTLIRQLMETGDQRNAIEQELNERFIHLDAKHQNDRLLDRVEYAKAQQK